ncbi:hypothetical protein [Floccifex sp.]|uniref:hypothetical protein n=1 Tax=Floccifex sp. TaxID=2815810 RepID=UPI002A75797C|nr:hypothetical protein [Floccifex sp.]MDD7280956.1 hypothetical protein [Erysipelotrichaceae bacterium]MDY2957831.1 hypothetical protein [Floccifex sp.]
MYKKIEIPYTMTFEEDIFTSETDNVKRTFSYNDVISYKILENQILLSLKGKMMETVVVNPNSVEGKNLIALLKRKRIPEKK